MDMFEDIMVSETRGKYREIQNGRAANLDFACVYILSKAVPKKAF